MSIFQPDFDKKYDIIDMPTPRLVELSGRFKQSFAYTTLRIRLPTILTGIIDVMHRDWDELVAEYGKKAHQDVRGIIGLISELKYELQTDKPFKFFSHDTPDKQLWNDFIHNLPIDKRTYYRCCWLYAECYMYRRIYSFFEQSEYLRTYDYFSKQKREAMLNTDNEIVLVSELIKRLDRSEAALKKILKINLWGNRCDLSFTAGRKHGPSTCDPFDRTERYDPNLLIDNTSDVWKCLSTADQTKERKVDFISDNAGYEHFTDLILADYLIEKQLATKVRFNLKVQPWFVSDCTMNDFQWTLQHFKSHANPAVNELGVKWLKWLAEGKFEVAPPEYFWTSPYEFYRMRDVKPELYKQLGESVLLIIKGDLNFRKLIGDFNWDYTQDFLTCLRGFQPTHLCSLRTVKADLICDLPEGVVYKMHQKNADWMTSGEYGTIQFAENMGCNCNH